MSTIIEHPTCAEFLARAASVLGQAPAEHHLFFTICAALETRPVRGRVYLLTIEHEDAVVAAALATPGRKWVLSRTALDVAHTVADVLHERAWPVPGILAPADLARAFAERWSTRAGCAMRPGKAQRIYELTHVLPPAPVSGDIRLAAPDDAATAARWAAGFAIDAITDETPTEVEETVRAALDDGHLYVWVDDTPVAMAMMRVTRRGALIGAVYTPPERRRRGYASALVAAVSAAALAADADRCILFTDLANPTSNTIYQRIGYRPVADWADWFPA